MVNIGISSTVTRVDFTIDEATDFDLDSILELIDEIDVDEVAQTLGLEDADEAQLVLENGAEAYIDLVDLHTEEFRAHGHIAGTSLVVCTGIEVATSGHLHDDGDEIELDFEDEDEETWAEDLGVLLAVLLEQPDLAKRAGLVCMGVPGVEQILAFRD